jgi:hypothetical protein
MDQALGNQSIEWPPQAVWVEPEGIRELPHGARDGRPPEEREEIAAGQSVGAPTPVRRAAGV